MSIFPSVTNGGVVVRTTDGVCVAQSETPNAYCPPAAFVMNCDVTALAEDCTARILPSQINAIVSELLCLGVALDPNGPWDCNNNCNLSTMFQTWASQFVANVSVETDGVTIEGDGTAADKIRLIPTGVVSAICGDEDAVTALALCLISEDAGNVLVIGADEKLFVAGTVVTESPITGNGSDASPIGLDIGALISDDDPNLLSLGTDEKLLVTVATGYGITGSGTVDDPLESSVTPAAIVSGICADDDIRNDLAGCMISENPLNRLGVGSDGGLYVPFSGEGINDGTPILFEIAFSKIASYADTELLSAYLPAFPFTIKANFPDSRIYARNPSGDIHLYLSKNGVIFAQGFYESGIASWILVSDYSFNAGDILEFRADGNVDFDVLAVTVVAQHALHVATP